MYGNPYIVGMPRTSLEMLLDIFEESMSRMYQEPNMEKLTINLPPLEIARIDILVEAGYYPSRAEFIRAAIRKTLDTHQDYVSRKLDKIASTSDDELNDRGIISRISGVGIYSLDKETFERTIAQGKKMEIVVVGMLNLDKDVTPEHIEAAVESVRVYGIVRAASKVKEVLQGKRKGRY
ncbi:MAG: ribbon-helix-helix protein, CopG family [Candidatus Bathyarchaeota archaeon]|jgi:Arc/MetJ-type ribon-helix-helix transcriptional regulator|nr:ribbon-helix-helix protein, CopG family [Candidatus Bathyarchaeota archaeon]